MFVSAAKLFLAKGEDLDSWEKYLLGSLYDYGLGVAQDFQKAIELYEAAATEGFLEAYYGLGRFYHEGFGVEQDFVMAADYFKKAADGGHPLALHLMAMMHFWGQGVPMDIEESAKWFRLAAEAGEPDAVSTIARLTPLDSQTSLDERLLRITKSLLLLPRELGAYWPWLEKGTDTSKKDANKFFLFGVIDFKATYDVVLNRVKRFTEEIMKDPDDLWERIAAFDELEWKSSATKTKYALHIFQAAHNRLWDFAQDLVSRYAGDARNIWLGQTPKAVLERLRSIGKGKFGVGEQLSKMRVGALMDSKLIEGQGDLKVDVNVMRVLGRAWKGSAYESSQTSEVTDLTRKMYPSNPWLLDQPLYSLGKWTCKKADPDCSSCFLRMDCLFFKHR